MTRMIVEGGLMQEAGEQYVQYAQLLYAAAQIHSYRTPKQQLPLRSWDDPPCKTSNTECIAACASPFLPSIGRLL